MALEHLITGVHLRVHNYSLHLPFAKEKVLRLINCSVGMGMGVLTENEFSWHLLHLAWDVPVIRSLFSTYFTGKGCACDMFIVQSMSCTVWYHLL